MPAKQHSQTIFGAFVPGNVSNVKDYSVRHSITAIPAGVGSKPLESTVIRPVLLQKKGLITLAKLCPQLQAPGLRNSLGVLSRHCRFWQKLGLSLLENEPNSTLPVISVPSKDGGPSVIADSFKIALRSQAAFVQHVLATTFVAHLRPMILQRVLEKLDERGAEYFTRTRQKWYCPEGVSIKELCPPGSEKYKQQMEKLRAGLNTINGFLLSNGQLEDDAMSPLLENYPSSPLTSSPSGYRHWVMGTDGPTFADFCLGGILV
ncbi:SubName: Full=Uncharacterized protein {ECO:0000313/EMBL:CCA75647.1} [Serendipita indica DSM 11827]|nr:SubName: Full=Uncharacterized protein {ECO:0000313/EMBL:CCA75647.1} [Serendipita indica DSM 11827]